MRFVETAEGWVLKLARDRADLTPPELHVLIVLAARHNRDFNAAHPKRELMARETHYSERQVQRILRSCETKGVLHIARGELPIVGSAGRRVYGSVYRFVGFDPIPERGDKMSESRGDKMTPSRGDTGGPHGETSESRHGETLASSPLYPERPPTGVEPGVEPGARARANGAPDVAPPRGAGNQDDGGIDLVVPPRWEELAPGVIRGRAGGEGEVRLLRVRCPQCERVLQPGELDDHQCEPVQRELLHTKPARVNNLGGHLDKVRGRNGRALTPPEVLAELAVMEQQRAERVVTLPPEVLEQHERLREAERSKNAKKRATAEVAQS